MKREGRQPFSTGVRSGPRIAYLDGLRGLSILLVLCHHTFGAWDVMFKARTITSPYSASISMFPVIAYGYLAVWLFFFISGYVIFLTLERCDTYREFMFRRWLRLFPAMLICSLIVFASAPFLPERPMGRPALIDLLPGLTFIDPSWWQLLLGHPVGEIEGSFWSLFVEFRFYILFGALYFALGKRWAVAILIGLFALGLYARYFHSSGALDRLPLWIALSHKAEAFFNLIKGVGLWGTFCDTLDYWMFGSGIFFALYARHKKVWLLSMSAVLGLLSAVTFGLNSPYGSWGINYAGIAAALAIMLIIPLSCVMTTLRGLWVNPFFMFFGFISYPLYLCHQNMIVAMMIKIHHAVPFVPSILLPALPIAGVIGLAWMIAKYGEAAVRSFLESWKECLSRLIASRLVLSSASTIEPMPSPDTRVISDDVG